jgi:predicted aspartyl protease
MWTDPFDPRARIVYVPIRLYGPLGNHVYRFVLDTGCAVSLVDPEIVDDLGYSPRMGRRISRVIGVGGVQHGYELAVTQLETMGLVLAPYLLMCHDMPRELGVDGLIGMDLLEGHILTLDGKAGLVTLAP